MERSPNSGQFLSFLEIRHFALMKNISIVEETEVTNVAPQNDCYGLTSNPFLGEVYVLYTSGLVIGIRQEDRSVVCFRHMRS